MSTKKASPQTRETTNPKANAKSSSAAAPTAPVVVKSPEKSPPVATGKTSPAPAKAKSATPVAKKALAVAAAKTSPAAAQPTQAPAAAAKAKKPAPATKTARPPWPETPKRPAPTQAPATLQAVPSPKAPELTSLTKSTTPNKASKTPPKLVAVTTAVAPTSVPLPTSATAPALAPAPASSAAAAPQTPPAPTIATAPSPAPALVRIFQIHYQEDQLPSLDPTFEPYDNSDDDDPLLEFNVFRKLTKHRLVKGADLWGAVSWKFTQKTGLTGADLRQLIASNPGHDVYYCNPHPEFEALYHNLWLQGEPSHPQFLTLCQELFEVAGLPAEQLKTMVPSKYFASSNYFVATHRFWQAYLGFVSDIITKANARLSEEAMAMLYSSEADRTGAHAGATYLPFIVERLFGLFLANNAQQFSAYKYPLPAREAELNVHQTLLRQMKDLSIKNKSLWMATCWVNYRNLYLSNSYGAQWCKKYLKAITPTDFKYA